MQRLGIETTIVEYIIPTSAQHNEINYKTITILFVNVATIYYIVAMKKTCTQCNLEKKLTDFPKLYSKKKDGSPVGDGRRANCRDCENKRRKKSYDSNPITRMMMNVKARCRINGFEFNLEYKDIVIPDLCPILEVPFELGTKENYTFSPTVDRIDSSKGYIKGNVKVISMLANRMKNNATREQCFKFAKNIIKYYDDIV